MFDPQAIRDPLHKYEIRICQLVTKQENILLECMIYMWV